MFTTQLPKEGPQKDHSMICVEMYYFWKLFIMWEYTRDGVHQQVCRQINLRDLQHAPKNGKFVSFKCIFKEGVVNCIQLEDPCLPPVFSAFSKVFQSCPTRPASWRPLRFGGRSGYSLLRVIEPTIALKHQRMFDMRRLY